MSFFENFYNEFKKHPDNKINLIPYSIDKYYSNSDIIVITDNSSLINPKIFEKTVFFIQPSYQIIDEYISHYDTALGVFIEDIPLYARGFINYKKSNFGNFIVINPKYKFPDTIWTVFSWYIPFLDPLQPKLYSQLNNKPLTSTFTMSELFFITENPTNLNIPVNVENVDEFDEIHETRCKSCKYRNICQFRYLKNYRKVYPTCDDYIEAELKNLNRLAKLYYENNLVEKIKTKQIKTCSADVKRGIYETFI